LDYSAYVLGRAGHIMKRYDFRADDDKTALELARKYLVISPVEIWQGERMVGTLQPDSAA
jgi:hypothetical protein